MSVPPFSLVYVAPDTVTLCDPCLDAPPTFAVGPDGAIVMFFQGDHLPQGTVRAVHRAGAVALVEVDRLTNEDDPRLVAIVLVRADSLPDLMSLSQTRLAAELRARYGEVLTVRQVATAGVVTRTAIYQAISRGRLQSTIEAGQRVFTPEQAAAWLLSRGRGRVAT